MNNKATFKILQSVKRRSAEAIKHAKNSKMGMGAPDVPCDCCTKPGRRVGAGVVHATRQINSASGEAICLVHETLVCPSCEGFGGFDREVA